MAEDTTKRPMLGPAKGKWQARTSPSDTRRPTNPYPRTTSGPNRASMGGKQSVRSENFGGWGKGDGANVSDTQRGVNGVALREDRALDAKLKGWRRDKAKRRAVKANAPVTTTAEEKKARRKAKRRKDGAHKAQLAYLGNPNSTWSKLYGDAHDGLTSRKGWASEEAEPIPTATDDDLDPTDRDVGE